jgi:c-di-GMP-binding flagellar brake protein YcgR
MSDSAQEALREAIVRNSAAVMSLPSAGMLRHFKSRFLAVVDDGFWIESVPQHAGLVDELIAKELLAGVAFKSGQTKIIFASRVLRRDPQYRLNRELMVEAMLLRYPEKIKAVQRRANYRVMIPSTCEISIRVWKIPEHWMLRDKPSATMEMPVRMRDLSTGGTGLLVPPKDGQPVQLVADARLRMVLGYAGYEALVEGRVQHLKATPDKSLRVGVQFKKLEDDLDGRQTLSRLTSIVGTLHREEVRRLRLGVG